MPKDLRTFIDANEDLVLRVPKPVDRARFERTLPPRDDEADLGDYL